jgi:GT2 family glycosyltransferase
MIYHFNTIFSGKSIGKYYNECCRLVSDRDWICLWDADVMSFHTFANWNLFLEQAINENPDVWLFGCTTGRIGTHKQRTGKTQCQNPNMVYHRNISEERFKTFGLNVRKDVGSISGLMMLFSKTAWQALGGFTETGMLGVDTDFSKRIIGAGGKIGILQGVYVMHYYRMVEGVGSREHLSSE